MAGSLGNLVLPAAGLRRTDQPVPARLDFPAQGRGADQAQVDFHRVEPIVARALRHAAEIQPGGPGPVQRLRLAYADRARCV